MQGDDLVRGMGYIDDELVEDALKEKAAVRWTALQKWLTAAACILIAVLVGWGVMQAGKAPEPPAPIVVEGSGSEEQQTSPVEKPEGEEEPVEVEDGQPEEPVNNPESEQQPVESSNGVFLPNQTSPVTEYVPPTLIEDYPGAPEAAYDMAVDNGAVGFSVPLQEAMEDYGDTVIYRIYVDIFKNGVQLAPDDPEVAELLASLVDDGIVSAVERVYQDGQLVATYTSLPTTTYEQLQQFKGDSAHGWMLFLYGERVDIQ